MNRLARRNPPTQVKLTDQLAGASEAKGKTMTSHPARRKWFDRVCSNFED